MNKTDKLGETNPALICGRFPAVKLIRELPENDYQEMREALEMARGWMANRAGGDVWSNNVRAKLNKALTL